MWFRHSRSVPLGTEWWTTVVRGPCNLWRSSPWTCTSGRMSWTKNDFHRDRSKMEEFLDHRRYCYTMNFSGWQSQFSRSWQPGSLYLAWVIWIKLHICELLLSCNWSKNGTKPLSRLIFKFLQVAFSMELMIRKGYRYAALPKWPKPWIDWLVD